MSLTNAEPKDIFPDSDIGEVEIINLGYRKRVFLAKGRNQNIIFKILNNTGLSKDDYDWLNKKDEIYSKKIGLTIHTVLDNICIEEEEEELFEKSKKSHIKLRSDLGKIVPSAKYIKNNGNEVVVQYEYEIAFPFGDVFRNINKYSESDVWILASLKNLKLIPNILSDLIRLSKIMSRYLEEGLILDIEGDNLSIVYKEDNKELKYIDSYSQLRPVSVLSEDQLKKYIKFIQLISFLGSYENKNIESIITKLEMIYYAFKSKFR